MKYFFTFAFLASFDAVISSTTPPPLRPQVTEPTDDVCSQIDSISICSGVGYPNTSFPNGRLHQSQADAEIEVTDFLPLFQTQCSSAVQEFFCSYYFPFCTYITSSGTEIKRTLKLQPCMHYCDYVRQRCEPEFVRYPAFQWPTFLNCTLFPDRSVGDLCLGPDDPSAIDRSSNISFPSTEPITLVPSPTMVASSSPLPSQVPSPRCSAVSLKTCEDAGFTNMTFTTELELKAALHKHDTSLKSGCSNLLAYFLCSFYAPVCEALNPDSKSLQPCREICTVVQADCKHTFTNGWPNELSCNRLPTSDSKVCSTPPSMTIMSSSSKNSLTSYRLALFLFTSWLITLLL